ncbi:tRNA threonylcarbamoyladenosine biosynthesis protein Gcp [Bacteroidetes bacterium UKL13-3]|nr:tRNA threonylcarbamoyladenosine biosynthesis protein Gcp [Bacteroidetes bacterium UKL13-3]HCP92418.1 tRNA (adenosine(37)-N6)-threonylcarbamoyltransferase complex transferase subunit TsaD [Bacteroidota bacterium]
MSHQPINILAIESSCDDTAAAVLQNGVILSNVVAGQKVHEQYGGVVPELASRAHQQNIVPVVDVALQQAGIAKAQLQAIAFTAGPGLIGSLMVGVSFAKSMAMALNIPLIDVNHMQAHVLAHFIDDPKPKFPFLCLTVSGGHTMITVMKDHFTGEIIGHTTDDAAGEAFDKAAKILGLPYPGGPLIDKYANDGNPRAFIFPKPNIPDLNYSFSGLKTAYLYFVQNHVKENPDFVQENLPDICASIQYSIIDHLMKKLILASEQTGIKQIALAGGVSANSGLRETLKTEGEKRNWEVFIPAFEYCTDNAAMIAMAGYFKFLKGDFANQTISPYAR